MCYPVIMLTRRIAFVFTILFYPTFTWLQLAAVFTFIQVMYNYLIYFYPMEDTFTNRMEIFGEVINLMLMYHVLLFTDFIADPELRYTIGYFFIGFIGIFICVHMYFLARTTFMQLKEKWRIRKKKKQDEAAQQERQEKMKMIYTDLRRSNTIKKEVIANFEEFENIDEEIEKYERAIEEKKRGIAF